MVPINKPTLAKMFVDRTKPAAEKSGALAKVLRERGIARYKEKKCALAYRDLSQAYQADSDDKEVLYYLAGCKLQLGSPEGARADYTSVLLDQPNNANAVLGRAVAHAALGDRHIKVDVGLRIVVAVDLQDQMVSPFGHAVCRCESEADFSRIADRQVADFGFAVNQSP